MPIYFKRKFRFLGGKTSTCFKFKIPFLYFYVIYVTWAGVICLICTHEPEGAQRPRASADISGKSRLPMLHMLCNTSGIRKIAQHYIGKDGAFDYGI